MIIDSHCHAWPRWPYQPPVPDSEGRGRVEQLLHEMDTHGVDQALVVCAQIEHNPQNNAYIADAVAQHPDRIHQLADVDSFWSDTYHQPGASSRLRKAAERWPIKGFTHYVCDDDDGGWFDTDEGCTFFQTAADLDLIASIHCRPHHQPAIRRAAERVPTVPILIHHMGHVRADEGPPHEGLKQVLESAKQPNIYLKLSGFAYAAQVKWDYPYSDVLWLVRTLYEHFGPHRMCWGSDYPVVRSFMTYRQSLEAFRRHCTFVPEGDKARILGQTLEGLLASSSPKDGKVLV